jgi:hypothetical protein
MAKIMAAIGRKAGPAILNYIQDEQEHALRKQRVANEYAVQTRRLDLAEAQNVRQEQLFDAKIKEIDANSKLMGSYFPLEMAAPSLNDHPTYRDEMMKYLTKNGFIRDINGQPNIQFRHMEMAKALLSKDAPARQRLYNAQLTDLQSAYPQVLGAIKEHVSKKGMKEDDPVLQQLLRKKQEIEDKTYYITNQVAGLQDAIAHERKMQLEREKTQLRWDLMQTKQDLIGRRQEANIKLRDTLRRSFADKYGLGTKDQIRSVDTVDDKGTPVTKLERIRGDEVKTLQTYKTPPKVKGELSANEAILGLEEQLPKDFRGDPDPMDVNMLHREWHKEYGKTKSVQKATENVNEWLRQNFYAPMAREEPAGSDRLRPYMDVLNEAMGEE